MSVASGCQLQIQLRGQQDIPLFAPQEDSFFRVQYRRCTNFASGEAEVATNSTAALGKKNIMTTISRSGDLLSQVYLHAEFAAIVPTDASSGGTTNTGWSLSKYSSYVNGLGYAMIDEITCLIGNKDFDTQDGEFMFMREQCAAKPHRQLTQAVGWYGSQDEAAIASTTPQELNVPLQFWFCNFLEQSLPMIGLYWHDVQLKLSLRTAAQLTYVKGGGTTEGDSAATLDAMHYICNFQYLDAAERTIFAEQPLEQIFIQHQNLGDETWTAGDTSKTVQIRFNHPVSDIMFAPRLTSRTSSTAVEWFNFRGNTFTPPGTSAIQSAETFDSAQIFFNNNWRTIDLSSKYLRQIPFHRSQDRVPTSTYPIYGYCFGAYVNDILHTGSANFSRYDRAEIKFTLWPSTTPATSDGTWANTSTVRMHARNWQLAKYALGMGGIKFAA